MDYQTGPNSFDQRRVWLDELLARPDLSPGQLETALLLADQLGIELIIYRRDLNNWPAGWYPVPRP